MQRQSTVEVATNRASHTAAGNSPLWLSRLLQIQVLPINVRPPSQGPQRA